jgi:hypothetical protein
MSNDKWKMDFALFPIRLSSVHLFFGNMLVGNRNLPNEGGGHEPDKLH